MSEDPTRGHGFDELARSLAEGSISRRRALKLFAGTAIAALIPSRAMAAVTCEPGKVKICDVPRSSTGTCLRSQAVTKCVIPGSAEATAAASNPCSCCGGCGGTDNCKEPKPRTCFSTPTTTTTAAGTTSTTTTAAGTTSTTTTRTCIPDGQPCVIGGTPCCSTDQPRECRGGTENPNKLLCRPKR
jgi:hypothetical protein